MVVICSYHDYPENTNVCIADVGEKNEYVPQNHEKSFRSLVIMSFPLKEGVYKIKYLAK
jgi:hypothetical protein|tara:strand:+ start:343 stop:519 length:177 start_codon:yes stop_codon:yes gene_type:complete